MGRKEQEKKPDTSAGGVEDLGRPECPSLDVIKAVAAKERPIDDVLQEHLNSCAACRRELLDLRAQPEWDDFYKKSSWGLYAVLFCIICSVVFRSCHHSS
jgi:hypothetical protein